MLGLIAIEALTIDSLAATTRTTLHIAADDMK
jgi:hypothetical protein